MVKPYLNDVGGKVENDVNLFTGGLNTYVDKGFIDSNMMPFVKNMTIETPPELRTRKERTTLAQYMENFAYTENLGSIIDLYAYDENQFYVITDQGGTRKLKEIYKENNRYVIHDINPLLVVPVEDKYYFTLARIATNTYVYVTGKNFKLKISVSRNPLETSAELVEDDHYGICCCHKGRLFLGNPDSNIITYSALFDYDNFNEMVQYQLVNAVQDFVDESITYLMESTNPYEWNKWVYDEQTQGWITDGTIAKTEVVIDTTTGLSIPDYSVIAGDFKVTNAIGKLISMKSYDDKLVIFCEHSMHVLYGDTPDMSMQNQFQLVDLNNNLGAIADRCIAIGGGRLYWLGDNQEVYEYTGSAINIISRPGTTRNSTLSIGAVSGVIEAKDMMYDFSHSKFIATSERLYMNIYNAKKSREKLLFVFDVYNRTWWCEDGEFNTIGNFSDYTNKILLAKSNGDILINIGEDVVKGKDRIYNFETNKIEEVPIEYEFHTRVYGADGADLRKTISTIWLQASAEAEVYLEDRWTSFDAWVENEVDNLVKIGNLTYKYQTPDQATLYRPTAYEQQVCYVEKMYGQRLNAFQIIIKGSGESHFYLMKREWRAR